MVHYRKNELSTDTALFLGLFYKPNPRTPGAPGWAGMPKFTIFLENFFHATVI